MVFGCDICHKICPLNCRPIESDFRFRPRATAAMSVRDIAAMPPDQCRALVPGTPLGESPLVSQFGAYPCDLARVATEWAIEQIQRQ